MRIKWTQTLTSCFAAATGGLLAMLLAPKTSFNSIMLGSVLSAWLAIGFFALVSGNLSIRGRRDPVVHYTGKTARSIGALIIAIGAVAAAVAISSL